MCIKFPSENLKYTDYFGDVETARESVNLIHVTHDWIH
jgi:hypothetical protein